MDPNLLLENVQPLALVFKVLEAPGPVSFVLGRAPVAALLTVTSMR